MIRIPEPVRLAANELNDKVIELDEALGAIKAVAPEGSVVEAHNPFEDFMKQMQTGYIGLRQGSWETGSNSWRVIRYVFLEK